MQYPLPLGQPTTNPNHSLLLLPEQNTSQSNQAAGYSGDTYSPGLSSDEEPKNSAGEDSSDSTLEMQASLEKTLLLWRQIRNVTKGLLPENASASSSPEKASGDQAATACEQKTDDPDEVKKVLRAIKKSLAKPPSVDAPAVFSRTEEVSDSEEEEGTTNIDLDEFVHSLNVIIFKLLGTLIKDGSLDAVVAEINAEAELLLEFPEKWLPEQVLPTGLPDVLASLGLSVGVMVFAVIAFRSGGNEFIEALNNHDKLTAMRTEISKRLQALRTFKETRAQQASAENSNKACNDLQNGGISAAISDSVLFAETVEAQSLKRVESALDHNFAHGVVGVSSMVSGWSIFSALVCKVAIAIWSAAVAKVTVALSIAATAVSTAVGAFFAPVGALAASVLGGVFLKENVKLAAELDKDIGRIDVARMQKKGAASEVEQKYQSFIDLKLISRPNFLKRTIALVSAFFVGTLCYVGATTGTAVFSVAAVLGAAAALSNPVGIAVILTLAVVGGVLMVAGSWHFIFGHDKGKGHLAYAVQQSPFLGNGLDALQTRQALMLPDGGDARVASSLRAELYDFAVERDVSRQTFLQNIAKETNKFREWKRRATDDPGMNREPSKARERGKSVLAALSNFYGLNWLINVFSTKKAEELNNAYELEADGLSALDLAKWFDETGGDNDVKKDREQQQRTLMTTMLKQQQKYLFAKLEQAKETLSQSFPAGQPIPVEVQATFKEAGEEIRKDTLRLMELHVLLALKHPVELNRLKFEFLKLQGVNVDELSCLKPEQLNQHLAEYLITDNELTSTRGILFEMHRNSFRLQHELQTVALTA